MVVMTSEGDSSKLQGTALEIVTRLVRRNRNDRRFIYALIASLVLDVSLTVTLTVLAVDQAHTSDAITQVNVAQCQSGNVARSQDMMLWDVFIADLVPPGTKVTPAERAELSHLHAVISAKDAQKNCVQIYG